MTIANSSGNKVRPGGITKAGNRYLRQMLVVGAMAVIRHAERNGARRAVARAIAGTHGDETCRHRTRKQDGAHSVGVDD